MKRQVVEIPIEVWEFSLQDAEQIVALHRETLRLMNENARLKAEVERLTKAGDLLAVHYTALSKCVTPNNAKSGSINDWTSVIDWRAAKEGKPRD